MIRKEFNSEKIQVQTKGIQNLYHIFFRKKYGIYQNESIIIPAILVYLYNKFLKENWGNYQIKPFNFKKLLISEFQIHKIKTEYLEIFNSSEKQFISTFINDISTGSIGDLIEIENVINQYFEGEFIAPEALYNFITNRNNILKGELTYRIFTPNLISEKIANLIEQDFFLNQFDENKKEKILDIGAGFGGILGSLLNKNLNVDLEGIEINNELGFEAKIFLSLHNRPFTYKYEDIFKRKEEEMEEKANWVIFDLPFFQEKIQFFIRKALQFTKSKALIVVPENFLFSNKYGFKELREELINLNILEKVISFPTSVFKPMTGLKTSLLIINLNKTKIFSKDISFEEIEYKRGNVNIFSSSKEVKSQTKEVNIPIEVISKSGYNLNVNRYSQNEQNGESLSGNFYKLKEICSIISGNYISSNYSNSDGIGLPYITVKNLAKENSLPQIDIENIYSWVDNSTKKTIKSQVNDILISKIGTELKATLVVEGDYSISNNIFILRIIQNNIVEVLPEYLTYFFRTIWAFNQLKKYQKFSNFYYISLKDLKEFEIIIPSVLEQKDFINREQSILLKKGLFDKKENDKVFVQEAANSLEHTLGNSLKVIENDVNLLKKYFTAEDLNPILNPLVRPENQEKNSLFNVLNRILDEVGSSKFALHNVNDWRSINKSDLKLETTEIKKFIIDCLSELASRYKIKLLIECSGNLEEKIDRERFKVLFRNFLENARKHSFVNSVNNLLQIEVARDLNDKSLRIWISNDGKPLPIDFKLEEKLKTGTNKGLKLINNIIAAHGGTWYAYDRELAELYGARVVFEIII
jgi:signal transduction histidine kinase